jgi:hypothetical protein
MNFTSCSVIVISPAGRWNVCVSGLHLYRYNKYAVQIMYGPEHIKYNKGWSVLDLSTAAVRS